MAFTLDSRLWGGLPLSSPLTLRLLVVYFDSGSGGFSVEYDGRQGCTTAEKVGG